MAAWRRPDEDFSAEVQAHLDLEAARLIEEGMTPEDARAAARKAFGNVTRAQERFHESTRWIWFEQFVQDLRYAARGLSHNPVFFATAVLTLAVGLGLLTVAFTVFNAYVLRPFAVRDPSSLYRLAWRAPDTGGQGFSWRDVEDLGQRPALFDAAIAEEQHFVSSDGRGVAASFVSGNYFTVLAPRMLLGRALAPADAGQPVAVLGHQAWVRLFAGDPGVLGREIDLDGRPAAIVGVLRPEFGGLDDYPRDVWVPTDLAASRRNIEITVRLRKDVTPEQAAAQLAGFAGRLAPPRTSQANVRALLLPSATANPLTLDLLIVLSPVFAAFGLVLLTACANVSNVMLARAVARHREIAVRLSLGASRSRLVRQLLTEGLVIAVAAGVSALVLASWTIRAGTVALFTTLPPTLASLLRVAPMPLDYRVFAFAMGVASVATLGFALLPALQASRQSLTDALRAQRTGTRGSSRLRSALVVAQVAVSVLLVVMALALARNFAAIGAADLGYTTAAVYSVNTRGDAPGLIGRAATALSADARIAGVAITGGNPLFVAHTLAAAPAGDASPRPTQYTFVSPEYFSVLQIPIAQGRGFTAAEGASAARVAIVSEATARAFWPGANPIGQRMRIEAQETPRADALPGYGDVTVIGTVRDVVSWMMFVGKDRGHIYLPAGPSDPHASALLFTARAGFRPDMTRDMFRRLGSDPEVFEVIPLSEMRDGQLYPLRAAAYIGGLLGGIALILTVSGLYGVLTYVLSQRTREIGIRMALGATARAVVELVVRQSIQLAGAGALIGLAIAAVVLKTLTAIARFEAVSLLDVTPFAAGAMLVLAAAALAVYPPARRATRVDPAETLRAEA